MKATKRIVLSVVIILVVLFQMAMPGIAFADEGAPPETPPTEEVLEPGSGEGEAPSVPEVLEQAPPGTEIVVLDETGDPEPLATQQAAEIMANSDPVWCPAGETPATDNDPGTPGNQNNCTPNQANITDLIDYLQSNSISGAGTIYFQEGVYGGPELSIFLWNSDLPLLTNLGLEGGWDLTNNVKGTDPTTFNVPLNVYWVEDVSLIDIVIDLTGYVDPDLDFGLFVYTEQGTITLNNVEASNNANGSGAALVTIDNPTGAGDVNVINSRFNSNQLNGLEVGANGNVTLDHVSASDNGNVGIYADTCNGVTCISAGDVEVTNSEAFGNGGLGFSIWANGDIVVDSSNAHHNGDNGLYADNCIVDGDHCLAAGNVELYHSSFDHNAGFGAYVLSKGDITLYDIYAGYNAYDGLALINGYGNGLVYLESVLAEQNDDSGILVVSGGNVEFYDVEAFQNFGLGAWLSLMAGNGYSYIESSVFDENGWVGLYVQSHGDISLWDVGAADNGIHGAYLLTDGVGEIDIVLSDFVGNGRYGLYAQSMDGDISLSFVNASYNGVKGAYLEATCMGNIFVQNSTFDANGEVGLWAVTQQGNIQLTNVVEDGDSGTTNLGAFLKSYGGGLITVTGSVFADNAGFGLEIVGTNDVAVDNVTAQDNGDHGALILSGWTFGCFGPQGINVTVTDGTYQNNGGYGFYVAPGPLGTLTLAGTINFAANTDGDYYLDLTDPCLPPPHPPEPPQPPVPPLPVQVVEVPDTDGTPVQMDCVNYSATILVLPNGDEVRYTCPGRGLYLIQHLQEEQLPGRLATGPRFVAAIDLSVEQDGEPLLVEEEGYFVISFKIPEGMENEQFSILFWDPSANNGAGDWVELPPAMAGGPFPLHPNAPEDGMLILRGMYREDGYVKIKVNFTGIFVLVAH